MSSWRRSATCYPRSAFINSLAMASPRRTTGSLYPTFVPVDSRLSHSQAISMLLHSAHGLPFVQRVPWEASTALLETTHPKVETTANWCPLRKVELKIHKGPYFNVGSRHWRALQSLRPVHYFVYPDSALSYSKGSRGLFVRCRVPGIIHWDHNFTELTVETVSDRYAIRASQGTTRQGISPP